tara:strand:+ start:4093 stop:4386 length:294 start_codon:yes stop_codon:yes gene_type:complete
VNQSPKPEKKLKATFCKCEKKNECKGSNHKTVHFGSKGSSTFIDHKDQKKKDAYLARHKVNENWNDPTSAGALSRWLLWNKESLSASISDFKKRFKL